VKLYEKAKTSQWNAMTQLDWSRDVDLEQLAFESSQTNARFNLLRTEPDSPLRAWGDKEWNQFVPFLDYPPEVRRVIYSTNAIESLHARFRRATRGARALPQRAGRAQVPLPCRAQPRPHRPRRPRWMNRWQPALNAFALTFEGRLFPIEQ
jgi:transposase-like protein